MRTVTPENLFTGSNTGAVDQTVQLAKITPGRCHCFCGLLLVGDISRITSGIFAQLSNLLLQGSLIEIYQRYPSARLNQQRCGRRPQPRGTTGNHENIIIQLHGSACSARSTAPGLCHGDILVRCRQAEQCSKASTCLTVLDTAANSTGRL